MYCQIKYFIICVTSSVLIVNQSTSLEGEPNIPEPSLLEV